MFSLIVSSQVVTDTNFIKLPTPVARQIALDLVDGDRAKVELMSTQELLSLTEQHSYIKDTVINNYAIKINAYENQISLYNEKEKIYVLNLNKVESKNKKLRFENKLIKTTGATVLVIIATLFIIL
jgi:hypothetical protein